VLAADKGLFMNLTRITTISAVLSMVLFGASCSRSTQSQETTPLPTSSTQNTQTQQGTQNGSTQQGESNQTATQTENQTETSNGQSSGGAESNTVKPTEDSVETSSTTTTASARSAKTCLEELQAQFGPDIVFPAQQLFPTLYEQARAQGAGGAAALKQTLSSAPCAQLK
jgi:hypothetical protein